MATARDRLPILGDLGLPRAIEMTDAAFLIVGDSALSVSSFARAARHSLISPITRHLTGFFRIRSLAIQILEVRRTATTHFTTNARKKVAVGMSDIAGRAFTHPTWMLASRALKVVFGEAQELCLN